MFNKITYLIAYTTRSTNMTHIDKRTRKICAASGKFLIAQFAITINSNVCPHIRVPNMLMRESYA